MEQKEKKDRSKIGRNVYELSCSFDNESWLPDIVHHEQIHAHSFEDT